ncbi:hypothetical protein ACHAQJ_006322 [Trichoderma viride]
MKTDQDRRIPSFWVSGKAVVDWENKFGLSQFPLNDALYQVIKATAFCQITADEATRLDIAEDFECIVRDLILDLHNNKQIDEYVFPRFGEEMPQTFYASDHAKIWWAIKSAEIGFGSNFYVTIDSPRKMEQRRISYSSENLQGSIHKSFTTENPSAASTMTAVSRSLSGNNFLLGIDDTVLFYAMDIGLFDKLDDTKEVFDIWRNKIDEWKDTVDYQAHSDDGHDTARSRPLRLALSILMSANNKCVDSRPAEETYNDAKSALLASSSPNGLFPGQLDEDHQPTLFDSQSAWDLFWHTTFEVPYILWKYRANQPIKQNEVANSSKTPLREVTQLTEKTPKRQDAMTRAPGSPANKSNIIEISDEWLYHKPSFFNGPHDLSDDSIKRFCRDSSQLPSESVIYRAIQNKLAANTDKGVVGTTEGYIIDVPKKNWFEGTADRYWGHSVSQTERINKFICGKRTPTRAKKRFFHFSSLTLTTALTCYIASSEKEAISGFFDRHASYDRYFFEETTAALNKWVTELHLPFYRVTKKEIYSTAYTNIAQGLAFPGGESKEDSKWVSRTTMSFRFDGDLFDRFWTCYFIEYNQWKMRKETRIGSDIIEIARKTINGASQKDSWRQRKILELVLLDMMLDQMLEAANDILEEVRRRIEEHLKLVSEKRPDIDKDISAFLNRFNLIDKLDNKTFLHLSHLWHELQRILQVVKDELNENLKTIKLWTDRGKEKGRDKPRWTPNDERKYRRAITKLQTSNGNKVHKLYRCTTSITYFDTALTKKLDIVRNERDYRGNNDIRLFTYVTVVFLPISFSTSLYSMSGSPSQQTLVHMIITAIVALLVTTIALVKANLLDKALRPIFSATGREIFDTITKSTKLEGAKKMGTELINKYMPFMGATRAPVNSDVELGRTGRTRNQQETENDGK